MRTEFDRMAREVDEALELKALRQELNQLQQDLGDAILALAHIDLGLTSQATSRLHDIANRIERARQEAHDG